MKKLLWMFVPNRRDHFLWACMWSTAVMFLGMFAIDLFQAELEFSYNRNSLGWLLVCFGPQWVLVGAICNSRLSTSERIVALLFVAGNLALAYWVLQVAALNLRSHPKVESSEFVKLAIVSTIVALVGGAIMALVRSRATRFVKRFRFSRTRVLILVAIGMFVVYQVNQAGGLNEIVANSVGSKSLIPVIVIPLLFVAVPWGISQFGVTWWGQFGLGLLGSLFGTAVVFLIVDASRSTVFDATSILVFAVAVLPEVLLSIRGVPKVELAQESSSIALPDGTRPIIVDRLTPRWTGSLVRSAPLASVLIAAIITCLMYDMYALRFCPPNTRWATARSLRQISSNPEFDVSVEYDGRGGFQIRVNAEFSETTNPKILERLAGLDSRRISLSIKDMNPMIETSNCAGPFEMVDLNNCRISFAQFTDLANLSMQLQLRDTEIVDFKKDGDTLLVLRGSVGVELRNPGEFAKLVDAIDDFGALPHLSLLFSNGVQPNAADWRAIFRVAKSTRVETWQLTSFANFPELTAEESESANQLFLYFARSRETDDRLAFVAAKYPIEIGLNYHGWRVDGFEVSQENPFWNICFGGAGKKSLYYSDWSAKANEYRHATYKESFRAQHWTIAESAGDSIESLWLPNDDLLAVIEPADEGALKSLSFDMNWLEARYMYGKQDRDWEGRITPQWTRFANLERLYFDTRSVPDDYKDLSALTKLRELGVHIVSEPGQDSAAVAQGLQGAMQLERLLVDGEIESPMVAQLQVLPALREVILIEGTAGDRQLEVTALQAKLPAVSVRGIPFDDYEALVPKEFRDHRERIRQEIIGRGNGEK